jgi:chemotaxis protein CheX
MPSDILQLAHTSDLTEVVGSVFETMLRLGTEITEIPPPEDACFLTAAVYLTGRLQGGLLIHCLPAAAATLAACFLDSPVQGENDVRDVLGELANMIAGNLKCSLLPGTHISIPSVVEGPWDAVRICGSQSRYCLSFDCEAGPFWITVILPEP